MIKIACETYAWLMPGDQYHDKLDHIVSIVGQAGFAGIEPVSLYLNPLSDPKILGKYLKENNLKLAAIALNGDWITNQETTDERNCADDMIELTR